MIHQIPPNKSANPILGNQFLKTINGSCIRAHQTGNTPREVLQDIISNKNKIKHSLINNQPIKIHLQTKLNNQCSIFNRLHFLTRILAMYLLQISYDFSYRLTTIFFGFMNNVEFRYVVFATLALPYVCQVTKKVPCGMSHQLLLTTVSMRDQKCR